jgi:hypothetical protein
MGYAGASETRPSGLAPSARTPPPVPAVRAQRGGGPAGPGRRGGASRAGAALGNRCQPLAAAPGKRGAARASGASCRRATPDVTRGCTPGAGGDRRACSVRRNAWGACQKDGGGQGAHAARWGERLGRLLVAGRGARWAAHGPHAAGEAMAGGGGAAAAVVATAGGPHTGPTTQSQEAPDVPGPASPVGDAPTDPEAGAGGPGGWASVGGGAGPDLAAGLLGRRRSPRLSRADASPSSWLTQAPF